jgi:predicted Zn-dependent protease
MIKQLLSLALLSAVNVRAASFPQEYQAATKLYQMGKFAEATAAFDKLLESEPSSPGTDHCLAQAAYCETQLKAHDKAEALVAKIKGEHLRTLCRMNVLTIQSKYADVVALAKTKDFN